MHSLLSPGSNIQRPHLSLANAHSFLSPSATPQMNSLQANLSAIDLGRDSYSVPGELEDPYMSPNVFAPTPLSHAPATGASRFTGFHAPLDRIMSPALAHNPIYAESIQRPALAQDTFFQASIKFNQDLTNVQLWIQTLTLNEQYIFVDNFLSTVNEEVMVYTRNQINTKLSTHMTSNGMGLSGPPGVSAMASPQLAPYSFQEPNAIDAILNKNYQGDAWNRAEPRPRSADLYHQSNNPLLLNDMSSFLSSRAMELTNPSHGKAAVSSDMHVSAQQLKMSALQTISSRAQMDSGRKDEGAASSQSYGRGRQAHLSSAAPPASLSAPASARQPYYEGGFVSPPPSQSATRSRNRSRGTTTALSTGLTFSTTADSEEPESKPSMPLEFALLALLNDIPVWLRSLRLHKYADNLREVPWSVLVYLDDAALEARGVSALGARRKLLKAFEFVRDARGLSSDPAQVSVGPIALDA